MMFVRLFDDANCLAIARGPRAIQARIGVRDVVAHRAKSHIQLGVADGVGEGQRIFRRDAEDMKREPLLQSWPDAGQMFELVDQALDRFREISHEEFSVTECGGPEKSVSLGASASAIFQELVQTLR